MSDSIATRAYTKVLPLGDIQYEVGRYADFLTSYDASWGRFNSEVAPVMGNHESNGDGYFDYFNGVGVTDGLAGTRGDGWYAYTLGTWRVIALNSECVGKECGTRQQRWLEEQLAASDAQCTLAYMHKPRFSAGSHGDTSSMDALWRTLADANVDVVLAGHDHHYERTYPLTADGAPTQVGTTTFVVGTGGKSLRSVSGNHRTADADANTYGHLELALAAGSYEWRFIPADGITGNGQHTDSGTATCH